jgi:YfiR/HmsC-like
MRQVGLRIVLITGLLAVALGAHAQDVSSESSEYLVKAGFIYNFAKLVEWPASVLGQPGHQIVIGVLGNDTFASVLDRVVEGKKIDGRPFQVKRLHNKEYKDCGCHILFISAPESGRADEIINLMKNASVLTIAETPGFAKRGGIINFTLEDSKVHFEVNVEAAKQAALNISSRLLSLAKIVQTGMTTSR